MSGRQGLYLIHKYFRVNNEKDSLYDLRDLMSVNRHGDSDIISFIDNWKTILNGMRNKPNEDTLRPMFYDEIKGFRPMKAYFDIHLRN